MSAVECKANFPPETCIRYQYMDDCHLMTLSNRCPNFKPKYFGGESIFSDETERVRLISNSHYENYIKKPIVCVEKL